MSGHIVPLRIYVLIFLALIVFTGVTTWVAFIDLGRWNTVVALAIACCKMLLVILYFMHVRYGSNLTRIVILASFVWLAILLSLTMADVLTRPWTPSPDGWGGPGATSSVTPTVP